MGRQARIRAERRGLPDDKFKRIINRAAGPVVRPPPLPTLPPETIDPLVELGMSALEQSEAAACLGSVQQGWRHLPPPAAALALAAGIVSNRVLQALDEVLRPLAEQLGAKGPAEISPDQLPAWVAPVLRALGHGDVKRAEPASEAAPQDEPIEIRAARSGLVIAS